MAHASYGKDVVAERHRHRYEFNNRYRSQLEEAGLVISAKSMDDLLVEMVELPNHPWFIACQAHPEFLSTPRHGHPLFIGFVRAAREQRARSEEHTSELQSLMRISYAVFCLKKKNDLITSTIYNPSSINSQTL